MIDGLWCLGRVAEDVFPGEKVRNLLPVQKQIESIDSTHFCEETLFIFVENSFGAVF